MNLDDVRRTNNLCEGLACDHASRAVIVDYSFGVANQRTAGPDAMNQNI
jgi:hypothetical protein